MHQDQAGTILADYFTHLGIKPQRADVVDYVGASFQNFAGNSGLTGVHRDHRAELWTNCLKNRKESLQFSLHRNRLRSRPGGLSSQVDDIDTLAFQFQAALYSCRGLEESASVGKRIRRDIDDSHQAGSTSEFNFTVARSKQVLSALKHFEIGYR